MLWLLYVQTHLTSKCLNVNLSKLLIGVISQYWINLLMLQFSATE